MLSCQRQRRGRRITALTLVAVFTLGFGATFLHVDNAHHTYCEQHQQFTHVDTHADEISDGDDHDLFTANPSHGDNTPEDHDPNGCEWLSWLHSTNSSLVQLQPHVFVLPPPAEPTAAAIPTRHQFAGHPIEQRHVSPINSPPAA